MRQPRDPSVQVCCVCALVHVFRRCIHVSLANFTFCCPLPPVFLSPSSLLPPPSPFPLPSPLLFLPLPFPTLCSCNSLKTIYRARFSSITEQAILHAFHTLTTPNWNEAHSVDARMELDLRIGCSFTRFQTTAFQVEALCHVTCTPFMLTYQHACARTHTHTYTHTHTLHR